MTNRSKGLLVTLILVLAAAILAPEPNAQFDTEFSPKSEGLQPLADAPMPGLLAHERLRVNHTRTVAVAIDGAVDWTGRHPQGPDHQDVSSDASQAKAEPSASEATDASAFVMRGPSIVQPPVLPFSYLGQLTQAGGQKALLLHQGQPLIVALGDKVGSDYTLVSMQPGALVFRYELWGIEQSLAIATIDASDEAVIKN